MRLRLLPALRGLTFARMNPIGIGARVAHPNFGRGVVVEAGSEALTIWFKSSNSTKTVSRSYEELQVLSGGSEQTDAPPAVEGPVLFADVEQALENILDRRLNDVAQIVPMAVKWNYGTLILKPADDSLQTKELPIETFFHKIVMLRDRLRLIEQKINAHKTLTDAEKVELQQYITASYGSLTTFNVLFRETHHQFKGSGKG